VTSKAIPVRVRVPQGNAEPGSNPITFIIRDRENTAVSVTEKAVFLIPR
jgi:hypothetical protein